MRGTQGTLTAAGGDGRSRILALDDEREIVSALERALRPRGFDTDPFTDAGDALDALRTDPDSYDAALIDVSLPTISGIEVLKRAKRIAPHLPIVMLTSDDRARTAVELTTRSGIWSVAASQRPTASAERRPRPLSGRS